MHYEFAGGLLHGFGRRAAAPSDVFVLQVIGAKKNRRPWIGRRLLWSRVEPDTLDRGRFFVGCPAERTNVYLSEINGSDVPS
jgi:hypothetical protein